MKSFYVEQEIGVLHYLQVGSGEEVMMCFPGFGQSAFTFSRLLSYKLKQKYTFYIIDLFYEGKSVLYQEVLLTKSYWDGIVSHIVKTHAIIDYTVMAYSIGTRVALCLSLHCEKLILIAPDGVKNRFVYKLIANNESVGELLIWLSIKLNRITKMNPTLRKWTNPKFVYKIAKIWRSLSQLPKVNSNVTTDIFVGADDIIADNKGIEEWGSQSPKRKCYKYKKSHFSLLVFVLRFKI